MKKMEIRMDIHALRDLTQKLQKQKIEIVKKKTKKIT